MYLTSFQFIPTPQPQIRMSVLYVCFFLSCKKFPLYHFSRFHRYALISFLIWEAILLCRLKSQGFYPKHLRTSLDCSNFFFNNGHFSSQSVEIKLARVHVDSPRQFLHLLFQYHLKCLLLFKQQNRWWHKAKTWFFFSFCLSQGETL